VLHPAECAGRPFARGRMKTPDRHALAAHRSTSSSSTAFPLPVPLVRRARDRAAGRPLGSFRAGGGQVRDGGPAQLDRRVVQDVFDPARTRLPASLPARTAFRQSAADRWERRTHAVWVRARRDDDCVIAIGGRAGTYPDRTRSASHRRPPSAREADLLAAARPAHLRVDLDLAQPTWENTLNREAERRRRSARRWNSPSSSVPARPRSPAWPRRSGERADRLPACSRSVR